MHGPSGPTCLQKGVRIHSSCTQAGRRHGRTVLPAAQGVSNFAQGPSQASLMHLCALQGHFEGRRLLVTGNKRASLNTQKVRLPLSLRSCQVSSLTLLPPHLAAPNVRPVQSARNQTAVQVHARCASERRSAQISRATQVRSDGSPNLFTERDIQSAGVHGGGCVHQQVLRQGL